MKLKEIEDNQYKKYILDYPPVVKAEAIEFVMEQEVNDMDVIVELFDCLFDSSYYEEQYENEFDRDIAVSQDLLCLQSAFDNLSKWIENHEYDVPPEWDEESYKEHTIEQANLVTVYIIQDGELVPKLVDWRFLK